ncbi:MAG: transketolase family protein [Lachnospiraceae bacterium]|nr:transketolase family protein [Lachnospiraceae bacterium]MBR5790003.1 transketolase family protein [Lachnospiraceae bacterium]
MGKSFLRNVVGEYMTTLGEKNEKVVMVNADLSGTCRNGSFVEKFPVRAFNTGIAEQNMVSFAAGLAYEGFIPYIFSMAPFLTMRACEQVRTDVAYGKKNVKMIGVYAGVSGGISGATHWALEDVGIMRSIPGITILEISDAVEARKLLDISLNHEGPIYIRCGVEPTEDVYDDEEKFEIGGSKTIIDGDDGAFLCSGVVVQAAVAASREIKEETGKSIRVVDMYSIKPIDRKAVIDAAKTGKIVVAQDHNVHGGLGEAVAEVIAEEGLRTEFVNVGIPDSFDVMAHAPYLYKKYGYDKDGLKRIMLGK